MRTCLLILFVVALACILANCKTVGVTGGPSGRECQACLQCNIACTSSDKCPSCKGKLQVTSVVRACPRCGAVSGRSCSVCGVPSVPAIQYYKCPICGRTRPGAPGGAKPGDPLPKCLSCKVEMYRQTVPLRACCPDCGVWSTRVSPCPRCGIDMSPM